MGENQMKIAEQVFKWETELPGKVALIADEKEITYSELRVRSEALAVQMMEYGVKRGDRIVYFMGNSPEFFYTLLAAGMIGAVAVGMSQRVKSEAVAVIAEESAAKLIICADECVDTVLFAVGERVPVLTCKNVKTDAPDNKALAKLKAAEKDVTENDPLLVLYTSGTTKKPKGAEMTHKNIISSALMQNKHLFAPTGFLPSDVLIHYYPVNHVSGCVECAIAPLVGGATIVILSKFDPDAVLTLTEKYRATIMTGVPAMWAMILKQAEAKKYDLSSVRCLISGASPLSEELSEKLKKICPIIENPLGMTETCGFCSYHEKVTSHDSVGKIMPELEFKLIDEKGDRVKSGEIGQLCYRGDSVIKRYLSEELPCDSEGYMLASDMAFEDKDGVLHLCGRNDDMFTVGGFNVFPQEVEDVLLAFPGITGAVVLPIPHERMERVCRAYLTVSGEIDFDKLSAYLEKELIYYKVPRNFKIVDKFPVNALGKVSRKVIAEEIKKEFSK